MGNQCLCEHTSSAGWANVKTRQANVNDEWYSSRAVDYLKDKRDIRLLYFYIDISDPELKDSKQLRLAFWEQLGKSPSLDATNPDRIWKEMGAVLQKAPERVYIIIDSLDRLDTDERNQLIGKLRQLGEEVKCGLSILLSSTDNEPLKVLAAAKLPCTSGKPEKFKISVGKNENSNGIRKLSKANG
jgi:GTP-binding protein EngB required for normal cell division